MIDSFHVKITDIHRVTSGPYADKWLYNFKQVVRNAYTGEMVLTNGHSGNYTPPSASGGEKLSVPLLELNNNQVPINTIVLVYPIVTRGVSGYEFDAGANFTLNGGPVSITPITYGGGTYVDETPTTPVEHDDDGYPEDNTTPDGDDPRSPTTNPCIDGKAYSTSFKTQVITDPNGKVRLSYYDLNSVLNGCCECAGGTDTYLGCCPEGYSQVTGVEISILGPFGDDCALIELLGTLTLGEQSWSGDLFESGSTGGTVFGRARIQCHPMGTSPEESYRASIAVHKSVLDIVIIDDLELTYQTGGILDGRFYGAKSIRSRDGNCGALVEVDISDPCQEDAPPPPGTDCTTAPSVTVPYTTTATLNGYLESVWWKFTVPAGDYYFAAHPDILESHSISVYATCVDGAPGGRVYEGGECSPPVTLAAGTYWFAVIQLAPLTTTFTVRIGDAAAVPPC